MCGGIPLQPVSISVLKEVNLACNTLLPAEPGIDAPPAPRGPGPSSRRSEVSRRTARTADWSAGVHGALCVQRRLS